MTRQTRASGAFLAMTILSVSSWAAPAEAFVGRAWDYLKKYQLGIDYSTASDQVQVTYEVPESQTDGSSCVRESGSDSDVRRCSVSLAAGASSGLGIFVQQPFRRKGFFHWDFDVSFGARRLAGELPKDEADKAAGGLSSLRFSLVSAIVRPYFQLGITPQAWWPDILVSAGPAIGAAAGTVVINGDRRAVLIGTSSGTSLQSLVSGFFEVEVVFVRFGEGAFSAFLSRDFTSSEDGSNFFPSDVGEMRDFRANFHRGVGGAAMGFGLKLLLNWP